MTQQIAEAQKKATELINKLDGRPDELINHIAELMILANWYEQSIHDKAKQQNVSSEPIGAEPEKWYLAGPMAGYDDHNFPAFHEAANLLRSHCGVTVINPAEINFAKPDKHTCLRRDLVELLQCSGIIFLAGWEQSEGCAVEFTVARAIGLSITYYRDWI